MRVASCGPRSFSTAGRFLALFGFILGVSRSTGRINVVCLTSLDAVLADKESDLQTLNRRKAQELIEKKTVINLLEAFAVAVKHYLRAEEGIYYEDLYHLVKFLPAYALPKAIGSTTDFSDMQSVRSMVSEPCKLSRSSIDQSREMSGSGITINVEFQSNSVHPLPFPASTPGKHPDFHTPVLEGAALDERLRRKADMTEDEDDLLPSRLPTEYSLYDFFPFSLLVPSLSVRSLTTGRVENHGKFGKKEAKMKAKLKDNVISHNIPLEISLYLVCILYMSGQL
jgi:hypothetical protein